MEACLRMTEVKGSAGCATFASAPARRARDENENEIEKPKENVQPGDEAGSNTPPKKRARRSSTRQKRRGDENRRVETQLERIKEAYSYDVEEGCFSDALKLAEGWTVELGRSWRRIEAGDRQSLLDMTWENMEQYYGDKWGETKVEKRRDMASRDARYFIVKDNERSVAGFCNYRFVVEEELVVLYVYELQISEKHRRRGLGRGLLQLAEDLALNTSMDGVCLTALKGNAPAMKFYQGLGYVAASFDPSVMFPHDADKYDYVIFNKLEAIYFKQGCPTKALTL